MATIYKPIITRIDTTANWRTLNPVPANGEQCIEILGGGLFKLKIGDGVSPWISLNYCHGQPEDLTKLITPEKKSLVDAINSLQNQVNTINSRLKSIDKTIYFYEKVDDYLYYTDFAVDSTDEAYAIEFFENLLHNKDTEQTQISFGGACSSIRKGNFYGRSYDWYYDRKPSFVIHNKPVDGRYESIGVAQSIYDELGDNAKLIPYLMLDGINEYGVFANSNVVPTGDMGKTTGTHADLEGDYICQIMLPKYVLDHFSNATDAVNWIENEAKIYAPYNANTKLELHFMIGDAEKTYIVEFVNNEAVILDVTDTKQAIMTNFYKYNTLYDENGHIDFDSVTNYGAGLERYNTLVNNYDSVSDATSMRVCIDSVKYTQSYTLIYNDGGEVNPNCWKTEFAADYSDSKILPHPMDLHANSPLEDYVNSGVLGLVYQFYLNRSRDEKPARTWQTVHSSVYDIENRKLTLRVQEQNKDHYFSFPVKCKYFAGNGIRISDGNVISSTGGPTPTPIEEYDPTTENLEIRNIIVVSDADGNLVLDNVNGEIIPIYDEEGGGHETDDHGDISYDGDIVVASDDNNELVLDNNNEIHPADIDETYDKQNENVTTNMTVVSDDNGDVVLENSNMKLGV